MSAPDPFNVLLDHLDIVRVDADALQEIGRLRGGRAFLDWLVLQARVSSNSLEPDAIHISEALRATTLEKEEADCADILGRGENRRDDVSGADAAYRPGPAELRRQAKWNNSEIEILQRELCLLRSRLEHTRTEVKHANKGLKLMRRTLDDVEKGVSDRRNQLHELFLEIDTVITTGLESATLLLKSIGIDEVESHAEGDQLPGDTKFSLIDTVSDAQKIISHSKENVSRVVSFLERFDDHLAAFSLAEAQKGAEFESEAVRLSRAFSEFDSNIINQADDPRVLAEMEKVIQELAENRDLGPTDVLLWLEDQERDLTKRLEGSLSLDDIDVQDLIQGAWSADQSAVLGVQETLYDKAKDDLSRILKHSEDLHNVLKGIFSHVKSTQVILEAFAEELQDVKVETHEPAPTFDENPAFEKALKATIEKFKGVRPKDDQPLILLTQQDVLRELCKIKEQLDTLEREEADWAQARLLQYRERPLHPTLRNMYAHSPLNTSPPFALPPDLQALEQSTRDRAKALQDLLNGLEKEVSSTMAKEKKRLGRFVADWCE